MSMTSELPHDTGQRGGSLWTDLPWLRRTLAFLLVGPMLGVFAVLLIDAIYGGMGPYLSLVMGVVFTYGVLVAIISAPIDGLLSRSLSIFLRAPLVAFTAAMVGLGSLSAMFGSQPPDMFWPLGGGTAFCAALCSLLSHDWRGVKT